MIDDIVSKLSELRPDMSETDARSFAETYAERADRYLGKNDRYFDSYWSVIELTVEEALAEDEKETA